MTRYSNLAGMRIAMVCASIALAVLAAEPIFAQQKPIVVDVSSPGAAAVKAQTVINKSGSYILSGNIVNKRANAASVSITASNVTLNLQGFSITSTVASNAAAIDSGAASNVVITNGIISGFGGPAILAGTATTISGITATGNSTLGGSPTIQAGNGSQIFNNTVAGGGGSGISCATGCLVRGNTVQANTSFGLIFSDTTGGYLGNILQGNDGNTVGTAGQVSGGASLSQNLCNGISC